MNKYLTLYENGEVLDRKVTIIEENTIFDALRTLSAIPPVSDFDPKEFEDLENKFSFVCQGAKMRSAVGIRDDNGNIFIAIEIQPGFTDESYLKAPEWAIGDSRSDLLDMYFRLSGVGRYIEGSMQL